MSASSNTERTNSAPVEWQPADLVRRQGQPSDEGHAQDSGFALVVLNQPLHAQLGVVRRIWNNGVYFSLTLTEIQKLTTDKAQVRIAADGGANCLYHAAGQHGDSSFVHLPRHNSARHPAC